jgi:hypothetical protein
MFLILYIYIYTHIYYVYVALLIAKVAGGSWVIVSIILPFYYSVVIVHIVKNK